MHTNHFARLLCARREEVLHVVGVVVAVTPEGSFKVEVRVGIPSELRTWHRLFALDQYVRFPSFCLPNCTFSVSPANLKLSTYVESIEDNFAW